MVRTAEGRPQGWRGQPQAGEGDGPGADGNSPWASAAIGPGAHGRTSGAGCPHPRLVPGIAHAPTAGDPALVERLIANLLDNAVRYNVPSGRSVLLMFSPRAW